VHILAAANTPKEVQYLGAQRIRCDNYLLAGMLLMHYIDAQIDPLRVILLSAVLDLLSAFEERGFGAEGMWNGRVISGPRTHKEWYNHG
jgi:hypothetical protein